MARRESDLDKNRLLQTNEKQENKKFESQAFYESFTVLLISLCL